MERRGRILLIVFFVLLAGCNTTPSNTATSTPTEQTAATPQSTTATSTTTKPTTTVKGDVCPPLPDYSLNPDSLAPEAWLMDGGGGWQRVESRRAGSFIYDATYKSPNNIYFYVEITRHQSVTKAREQGRIYRNDTNFQISSVYGQYTLGIQAYRKNQTAITILSSGFTEGGLHLLATINIPETGAIGKTCASQIATITPPTEPQVTSLTTPTTTPSPAGENSYRVTVVEVVDGDTMEVQYQNGTVDTIRLLGIDTPEIHVPTNPGEYEGIPATEASRDWLRQWGHKASEYVRTKITGETIRVVVDEQADRRGSYGRLLVYAYHDDELLNHQLIQQGYARLYDTAFSKRSQFSNAEKTAQSNNVGLWGFEPPTDTPTTTSSDKDTLSIALIHADAEGNDHENENDEYIVFENTGETTLDLSGWIVRDTAGHRYQLPNGFTLAPGEQVTLYTGSGTNTDTALYWGSDSAIWNNGGDTIIVENDEGNVVLEEPY